MPLSNRTWVSSDSSRYLTVELSFRFSKELTLQNSSPELQDPVSYVLLLTSLAMHAFKVGNIQLDIGRGLQLTSTKNMIIDERVSYRWLDDDSC
jgi:hypothetical protein